MSKKHKSQGNNKFGFIKILTNSDLRQHSHQVLVEWTPCLKWNDFENNVRDSFRELRKDQDNFDVTLATDDGHTIQAHKIILSAGSKFFSNILR